MRESWLRTQVREVESPISPVQTGLRSLTSDGILMIMISEFERLLLILRENV